MYLSNPLRSIAPTVDADVLAVLAGTQLPLTGLRVQQLAGRSYGQVRSVLRRLVDEGLVIAEQHGNTNSYVLNRDHVLAEPLLHIVNATSTVEQQISELLQGWEIAPDATVLFGSFARRDGDTASDIDLLIVRPPGVAVDEPIWATQRERLVDAVEGQTGNRLQIVEVTTSELTDAVRQEQPLIDSLRRDGVVITGTAPALNFLAATVMS